MAQTKANPQIELFLTAMETLLPTFLADPIDQSITGGNVSVMVIEENGRFYGQMFGTDRARQRGTSHTAWQKSTQVLITGYPTRKFEELVYSKQLDPSPFGINDPDFVGWPGGLPATLADGTKVAIAVSGMRGVKDAEIIRKAAEQVPGMKIVDKL
jgi:uncharacterized protein GlcG (DUF336 family)